MSTFFYLTNMRNYNQLRFHYGHDCTVHLVWPMLFQVSPFFDARKWVLWLFPEWHKMFGLRSSLGFPSIPDWCINQRNPVAVIYIAMLVDFFVVTMKITTESWDRTPVTMVMYNIWDVTMDMQLWLYIYSKLELHPHFWRVNLVFFLSHFNIHSIPRDIFASAGIVKHPLFTIPSHRLSHRSPAVYFNWWARWIKRWWCSPSVRPLGTVTDGINGDFRLDGTSLGDLPFKPPLRSIDR
jgi:hypothetical protein